jgi:ABC-type transporter Mla subunit MlaD
MASLEERVVRLEQQFLSFQEEAGQHIRETDENTTILLGVIRSQGRDIRRIFERLEALGSEIAQVQVRLDRMDQDLGRLAQQVEQILTLLQQQQGS